MKTSDIYHRMVETLMFGDGAGEKVYSLKIKNVEFREAPHSAPIYDPVKIPD